MTVTFGEPPATLAEGAVGVRFYARADDQTVRCLISEEALQTLDQLEAIEDDASEDDAGENGAVDLLASFQKHKERIETVAREMIEAGYANAEGELLILEGNIA